MAFAQDRDLLVYEPTLFRDVEWSGQRLLAASDAEVSSGTLLSLSSDFLSANIETGTVALVNGVALEILSVLGSPSLSVSLLRPERDGPAQPPMDVVDASLVISTFTPQLETVHEQALRCLGIGADSGNDAPSESDITNPEALIRLECLGALHLIFTAAAALGGTGGDALSARASMYRDRFAAERRRVRALIDLNGDGAPDAARSVSASRFVRV